MDESAKCDQYTFEAPRLPALFHELILPEMWHGFIFHSIHNVDLSKVTMATSRQSETNTRMSMETGQNKLKSPCSHPVFSPTPSIPNLDECHY